MDGKTIRVRFAPSPTGNLHVGNLRAALFNWVFAKKNGGKFVIRIEDTDLERSEQCYVDSIMQALEWVDIKSDEPVVHQSKNRELHQKLIEKLVSEGKAYRCSCSRDDIQKRLSVSEETDYLQYDGYCRDRDVDSNSEHVVRFKLPDGVASVSFEDLIHGTVTVGMDQMDDFVIARSDGTPVYNFVVVVDDSEMKISHVIRGQDHLSNTPKQILLYESMGLDVPKFAHLPMILGPSGARLSKRDAATSVLDYKKNGYLPKALCNYLVRLGWSHGDQEVFSREEMVEHFSFDHVGKNGAIFDVEKLRWLNGLYMRDTDASSLLDEIDCGVDENFSTSLEGWGRDQMVLLVSMYKEREKTLLEVVSKISALHSEPTDYDESSLNKWIKPESADLLRNVIVELSSCAVFKSSELLDATKSFAKRLGVKLVDIAQPVRIAITGTSDSPSLFSLLEVVGKTDSLERLNRFLGFLEERYKK